jgi:allophanate hydrolase
MRLDFATLRALYESGEATPSDVIASVYDKINGTADPVWISLVPREIALARARAMESDPAARRKALYGLPFAIKDNIDLGGLPTTAGCPAYSYTPVSDATVVRNLIEAGAIPVGKTNLDQFATGLVGTRSPYGACSSVFDERYISGGSSSGSAVSVASRLVSFALGTDTAGSGRVPAAFNNLIGLKPSRGLLSATGVVPACRTLDCVSILTSTCHDARLVWKTAKAFDPADPYSRDIREGQDAAPWLAGESFRFGVPSEDQLQFFGDDAAAALFRNAVLEMEKLGGEKVEIDFSIFRAAAELLYAGPWVAERLAAIRPFFEARADEMNPVVREIIAGARRHMAVDAFKAAYRLEELRRAASQEWSRMDVLITPTTGTIYTHEEIEADPIRRNTNLGYYTNFANLLDLAAVAAPAGFRPNGLPFGISLIGPAFSDEDLLILADRFHRARVDVPGPALCAGPVAPGCLAVAVVGAHLTGQALNWQLTDCGARLLKSTRTAASYRLYTLGGTPARPGLVRQEGFDGPGIEVEVWAMPANEFGSFVAAIPPPLGIGSITLDGGEVVKGFLCEPYAVAGAEEITKFGGWRNYLSEAAARQAIIK